MGIGGGAASASLVWGLWGFPRWPRTSGKEHPIIAGCCAYADYDGGAMIALPGPWRTSGIERATKPSATY